MADLEEAKALADDLLQPKPGQGPGPVWKKQKPWICDGCFGNLEDTQHTPCGRVLNGVGCSCTRCNLVKVVTAVIRRDDGAVLLARRAPGKDYAGLWETPGGKVRPNEGGPPAIDRELQEELGFRMSDALSCDVLIAGQRITLDPPEKSFHLVAYVLRVSVDNAGTKHITILEDQTDLRWFPTPALLELWPALTPGTKAALLALPDVLAAASRSKWPSEYFSNVVGSLPDLQRPPQPQLAPEPSGKGRADWDAYFMQIAAVVATRATCDRKHVGAVLVRGRTILSTGYNGAPRGLPHCIDAGHDLVDVRNNGEYEPPDGQEKKSCQRVVHAELNVIAQAAREGVRTLGAELYVTHSPCWPCFRVLINAGIRRVVYGQPFYRDAQRIADAARMSSIELIRELP